MTSLPDIVSVVFRAISFVLLFQAVGVATFLALFGGRLELASPTIKRLGIATALTAISSTTIYYLVEAARMTGEMSGVIDPSMQNVALVSSTGAAFACRVLGLAIVAVALAREARAVALLGVLLAVASFGLTGHLVTEPHRANLTVVLIAHVSIGMMWFGSLLPLCVVTARERGGTAAGIVRSYSSGATWLVPLILLSGVLMATVLISRWNTFSQPYGQLLIAKAGLFSVLMGLAALNRFRLGPSLGARAENSGGGAGQGGPGGEAHERVAVRFRRVIFTEFALICAVLVITAVLTEFYSPGE